MMDSIAEGVALIDRHARILRCNQTLADQSGSTIKQLSGFNLLEATDDALKAPLRRALAGQRARLETVYRSSLGGRQGVYQLTFLPVVQGAVPGGDWGDTDEVAVILLSVEASSQRSQGELQAILDAMPDMIYRTDASGRVTYASRAIERILGFTADEAIGLKVSEHYVDSRGRQAFMAAMFDGGGEVQNFDAQLRHKDGRFVWVSISSRTLHDDHGEIIGVEGAVRNIDDRKQAEQSLSQSRTLIQILLDASSDAIMLIDHHGTLLSLNSVMSQRFGHLPGDLVGRSLWALFPADISAQRRAVVADVIRTASPMHSTDERDNRYLSNALYPVFGASGEVDMVAIFSRDITGEVLNKRKIQQYIQEIEQSNRDLEAFAFAASHDLREPLRMIGSFVNLLQNRYSRVLDGDGLDYMAFIKGGVHRLSTLIGDLLDYARIGQGQVASAVVAMDVLLRQVWADHQLAVDEVGATVLVDDGLPTVLGFPMLIERLLSNLVVNAVHYRDVGRPLLVRFGYRSDVAAWYFQDNGVGIDPQYHQRIFLMFQRLGSGWKSDGTGLGLAICTRVVERHGGRIWVESSEGCGATFFFTLSQ